MFQKKGRCMKTFKIDNTDIILDSATKLAKFIGCVPSNITWHIQYKSDKKNHFRCAGYEITILEAHRPDYHKSLKRKETRHRYYENHKEYCKSKTKEWCIENKDRVKEYKEKWRKANQEWYNAYYREYRKRGKK